MTPLQETFARFEADPEFQAMSYRDQTEARAYAAADIFSKDPEFLKFDPANQQAAVETAAKRAPVFSDPDFQAKAQQLWQMAADNDPRAAEILLPMAAARGAVRNSIIGALFGKVVGDQELVGSDADKLWESLYDVAKSNPDLANKIGIAETTTAIVSNLAEGIAFSLTGAGAAAKAIGSATQLGRAAKTIETASIVLNSGKATFAEMGAAVEALKTIQGVKGIMNPKAMWMASRMFPALAGASAEGAFNLVQTNAIGAINNDPEKFTDTIGKVAWMFGTGAALDFGVNMLAREGLPRIWNMAKFTFKKGESMIEPAKDSMEYFAKALPGSAGYKGKIPDEVRATLDQVTQDKMAFADTLKRLAAHPDDIMANAENRAMFQLGQSYGGVSAVKVAPSKYRVTGVLQLEDGSMQPLSQVVGSPDELADVAAAFYRNQKQLYGKSKLANELYMTGPAGEAIQRRSALIEGHLETLKSSGVSSKGLKAYNRAWMSADEITAAAKQGEVFKGYIELPEGIGQRITSQKALLPGKIATITPSTAGKNPNVAIVVKNALVEGTAEHRALGQLIDRALKASPEAAPEALLRQYALDAGYDALKKADGSLVTFMGQNVKLIVGKVNAKGIPTAVTAKPAALVKAEQPVLTIKQTIMAKAKVTNPADADTLAEFAQRHFRYNVDPKRVAEFDRAILRKAGVDVEKLPPAAFETPPRITTPAQLNDFIQKHSEELSKYITENGGKVAPVDEVRWLSNKLNVQPKFKIDPWRYDQGQLEKSLADNGFIARKVPEGWDIYFNGSQRGSGKNLADAANQAGFSPEKLPGPKEIEIEGKADEGTFSQERSFKGGLSKALSALKQSDVSERKLKRMTVRTLGDGWADATIKVSEESYEVAIPAIGAKRVFPSAAGAKEWLSQDWKKLPTLQAEAQARGIELLHDGKQFVVNAQGQSTVLKSFDDLAKWLEAHPRPTNAPDLFEGIDPKEAAYVQQILADNKEVKALVKQLQAFDPPLQVRPKVLPQLDPMDAKVTGWRDQIRHAFQTFDWWMDKTFSKQPQLAPLKEKIVKFKQALHAYHTAVVAEDEPLKKIVALGRNKIPDNERLTSIQMHIEAWDNVEKTALVDQLFGKLNPQEELMANRLREWYANTFNKFRVDPIKWQNNYGPHLRNAISAMDERALAEFSTAEELINHIPMERGMKFDMEAWFHNMRSSDVVEFARETNALRLAMRYNRHGHRGALLEGPWDDIYEFAKANQAGIPEDILNDKLPFFRDKALANYTTLGEREMERFGMALADTKIGKAFGLDPEDSKSLYKSFFAMGYLTTMGFRPFNAIRNANQVWATMAPRFGNDVVFSAMKRVRLGGENYFNYVKSLGIIRETPPVIEDIAEATTMFGQSVQTGLQWIKNSDDYGRMLAYGVADEFIDRGAKRVAGGVSASREEWKRLMGLHAVEKYKPDEVRQIMEFFEKGGEQNLKSAKYLYANVISDETIGNLTRAQAPGFFSRSFLGRLFGQYGTYSALYRESVFRGFSGMPTVADKAAFMVRFLGNNLAIFGALAAIGIKANDFIPFQSMAFGGGPNFELATDALAAMGTGYKADIARNRLLQAVAPVKYSKSGGLAPNMPELLPGGIQLRFLGKALDAAETGDYWKSFLNLTTTNTW